VSHKKKHNFSVISS